MRGLSASELLRVWEQGLMQKPVQKALMLLTAACPEASLEQLAQLSIGQRDGLLLTLREWTFGSQIESLAICPECSEKLELNFQVSDIRTANINQTPTQSHLFVKVGEYNIEFRLPNSLDLIAIAAKPSQKALLERCLTHCNLKEATDDALTAVVTEMAKADPLANIHLDLTCPACGYSWRPIFDIVSFFWSEIHAWAIRVLREVHILASAYSWQEADILAMNPYRRRLYLEMLGQ